MMVCEELQVDACFERFPLTVCKPIHLSKLPKRLIMETESKGQVCCHRYMPEDKILL